MIRKGVTFIEMIIVVTILGILTVATITTFDSTRSRLLYQTKIGQLQELILQARSLVSNQQGIFAENESDREDISVDDRLDNSGAVVWFEFNAENQVENVKSFFTDDIEAFDYELENNRDIREINLKETDNSYVLIDSYTYDTSPEIEFTNDLYIYFARDGSCGVSDSNANLVQIPLKLNIAGETPRPIRNLYFHKVSCNPEVLIETFFE